MENKVITLENGLEFLILTTIKLNNETYLYLSSLDEDLNLIFVKLNDEYIEVVEDGETLGILLNEVGKQVREQGINEK